MNGGGAGRQRGKKLMMDCRKKSVLEAGVKEIEDRTPFSVLRMSISETSEGSWDRRFDTSRLGEKKQRKITDAEEKNRIVGVTQEGIT